MTAVPPGAAAGLTGGEARRRLAVYGTNTVQDVVQHPINRAMKKLWAPVPWMLEAAVLLQLALGEYFEASAIGFLLVFNAGLGFFQEGRAQATLEALKSRLPLTASARRDGVWRTLPAAELVQGDVVKLSLGAVVPADVRLIDGSVLIDQSMLTGESLAVEAGAGFQTYAGALIRRGEAIAEIVATGARTKYGRSAELIRSAHVESTEQKTMFRVVCSEPQQLRIANVDSSYAGVQRSGDFLRFEGAPPFMELPTWLVADRLVDPRHHAVQHAGDPRYSDGAITVHLSGRAIRHGYRFAFFLDTVKAVLFRHLAID